AGEEVRGVVEHHRAAALGPDEREAEPLVEPADGDLVGGEIGMEFQPHAIAIGAIGIGERHEQRTIAAG
ncbi:MAG: hypothetical protein ACK559_34145, partial [bacterium]